MPSSMALLILRRNLHGRTSSLLQARLFSRSPESAAAVAPKRRTSEPKPIEKILAVNRGEIACRIMRTAGRLGIRTVAFYSDADAGALHIRCPNEAVGIGPAPAHLSYLSGASIVEATLLACAQGRG
ncbi:hypothetical protein ACJRO7_030626 [Eucalyptus globulus]|uniref:Biotin carboxylation domain-containing protein n=1 Tax=Eucalyptus globulus TaxID=34317 RepID=A0ABD3JFK1_EUCGL